MEWNWEEVFVETAQDLFGMKLSDGTGNYVLSEVASQRTIYYSFLAASSFLNFLSTYSYRDQTYASSTDPYIGPPLNETPITPSTKYQLSYKVD